MVYIYRVLLRHAIVMLAATRALAFLVLQLLSTSQPGHNLSQEVAEAIPYSAGTSNARL